MIDKRGMKMMGLRKAVGNIKANPFDFHSQVNYNVETGRVWTDDVLTTNSSVRYEDHRVVDCGKFSAHDLWGRHRVTMQGLADAICTAVKERE